ncbi:polysaccharide deacetylase family protein [Ilumatobacter sp.]|uniref:polysaccharide deacetylase family protein n=1 Tax=Ilumatobacter sp. TaxID=1967498 RepID=UPI003AF5200D
MSWYDVVRRGLAAGPARRALASVESKSSWPKNRLVVLMYHRIDHDHGDGRYPGLISATPNEFRRQIGYLADHYRIVSIDELRAAALGSEELPDRAVLLTFDDAVDDFRRNALPTLSAHGAPAAVFVPTAFVGDPEGVFWWDAMHAAVTTTERRDEVDTPAGRLLLATATDRSAAYRRLRDYCLTLTNTAATELATSICADVEVQPPPAAVMDWDDLRAIESAGIACCPHTRSHAHLDHLTADEIREEVGGSLADLRRELAAPPAAFAYPAGLVTDAVTDAVRDAGIELAFTTERGTNIVRSQDPLALRRINVSRRTGFEVTRTQFLPLADRLRAHATRREPSPGQRSQR